MLQGDRDYDLLLALYGFRDLDEATAGQGWPWMRRVPREFPQPPQVRAYLPDLEHEGPDAIEVARQISLVFPLPCLVLRAPSEVHGFWTAEILGLGGGMAQLLPGALLALLRCELVENALLERVGAR